MVSAAVKVPLDVTSHVIEDDAEQIVRLVAMDDILVGGDADGTIHVWEGPSFERRWRLEDGELDVLYDIAVSPDAEHAAAVGVGGVEVWDLTNGSLVRAFDAPAGREVQAVAFDAPERIVAVGDAETLWLFDIDGNLLSSLPFGGERNESLTRRADGTFVCAASRQGGGRIQMARVVDDQLERVPGPSITEPTDGMSRAEVSPDGSMVAFTGRNLHVYALADGRHVASFAASGATLALDTERGLLTDRWSAPVFVGPRRIACGTPAGGVIRVFDLDEKRLIAMLEGHGDRHISALAMFDGRLISAGRDFCVRVTDLG